ncbi:hypothetical protein IJG73_01025 [Candidatus Saccharibacteria bacterium]|nr:hypothetical protein [Candidatus Saccharibacteria bacterium]
MKNIIYFEPQDATTFDLDRYQKSLNKYAKVPAEATKAAVKELDKYENMHVSLLVETGTALINQFGDEQAAKKYFTDHQQYFNPGQFERLRRITGYLVGSLERWNDGKKAEEAARVKHSVNSCVDDAVRAAKLQDQYLAQNVAYAGHTNA